MENRRKSLPAVLLILPIILVPAALLVAIPALEMFNRSATVLIVAVAVVFAMSYAHFLSLRALRGQDEVQKAGAAFTAQWGPPIGQVAFGLLLVLPFFTDFVSAIVHRFVAQGTMSVERAAISVSLAVGLVVLLLLESIGRVIVHTIWWKARR